MSPPDPPLLERLDTDALRLHCPAKVNLALSVGSPRLDGMHPIASWMVPIALGDTLSLRRSDGLNQFAVNFAQDAPLRRVVDWPLSSDLAYRAWVAVKQHAGRPLPITARLEKYVPAGAGLGGGSADAAGMIDGLNTLFTLGLDRAQMLRIAGTLGSDVVFQLSSRLQPGSALVTGMGELIQPRTHAAPVDLLLVLPGVGCSTPAVYQAFDQTQGTATIRTPDIARITQIAQHPLDSDTPLFNDLAEPACRAQPEVRRVMDTMHNLGVTPHVTGSGSAVFAVLDPNLAGAGAAELLNRIRQHTDSVAVLTQTSA